MHASTFSVTRILYTKNNQMITINFIGADICFCIFGHRIREPDINSIYDAQNVVINWVIHCPEWNYQF